MSPAHPFVEPALEVHGLTVDYGEVRALHGADLTLAGPGITALLGANGAGKSTLVRAVLGLVPLASGRIEVFGQPADRARAARTIGYVGQAADIDRDFPVSVADVVLMGRHGLGAGRFGWRPRRLDRDVASAALDAVGLTHLAGRQIGRLSGGQAKRVMVARAIAQQARLLLLDEPFAGVDAGSECELRALLCGLADDGATILLATHDLASVPELCDEAVLWQRGLIAQGTPRAVLTPERLAAAYGLPHRSDLAPTGGGDRR